MIKSLNGEFGVIAVAGMYRTGKSYLLNRMLLNRQKGFSVGPTVSYHSQISKIIGNIDLNGSKGDDISKEAVKPGDNNKQSSGDNKDVTSNPSTNTNNTKEEKK